MVERVVEVEAEGASCGNTDGLRGRGGVGIAGDIGGGDVLDWGVVDGLTNGSAGCRGSSNNLVPDVCGSTVSPLGYTSKGGR